MDVVTSTAFSVDIDSLNNPSDPFVSNVKKMLKFDLFNPLFLLVALFPFTGPILEKMKFSFFPTAVTDFFYASLAKIKSGRDTGNTTSRVDFLQLMIDSQKGSDTKTGEEQTKGTCPNTPGNYFYKHTHVNYCYKHTPVNYYYQHTPVNYCYKHTTVNYCYKLTPVKYFYKHTPVNTVTNTHLETAVTNTHLLQTHKLLLQTHTCSLLLQTHTCYKHTSVTNTLLL
uniref:Cytochrome P450 3A n=1 Tax=Hucho hucho TaxID=62062 RepID=A0A4W5KJJ2_9TELE